MEAAAAFDSEMNAQYLAAAVDVSAQTIRNWSRDDSAGPNVTQGIALAAALRCKIADLCEGKVR